MAASPALSVPQLNTQATAALADASKVAAKAKLEGKAKGAAKEFEAVFLNSMFQQMFNSIGKGPFGGGPAAAVWRTLLTDEYAKSFANAGGIGIADHVQRALLAQQEIK